MSDLKILVILFLLLNSCNNRSSKTTKETLLDSVTANQTGLIDSTLELDTVSEVELEEKLEFTDVPVTFDSTGKPSRPVFRNLQVDTSQLFGVWTIDPSFPNADFSIDKNKYYIADFDGNPVVPYILDRDSLIIFFEWGEQRSRISMPTPDLLIMSSDNGLTSQYERFEAGE